MSLILLYFCAKDVRETAYLSLVRPILEYAGTVWDPNCLHLENDLERVQKRAAIFVPKSLVYLYHFAISYSLRWNQLLCNRHNHQQTNVYLSLCLDFEKDFDTVPHEQLKAKLYRYGITGKTLVWIDPFLCYRKQCVVTQS
jgi:hypothetical protein